MASSLGLLLHQKEFILTQIRSKPFRACIHLGISKNLEAYKVTGLYQKIHRKSLRPLSTVHPTHEKRCFLCIGSSLSGRLRGYQEISHKTSSLGSFHIRETIPTLCESYKPFSWCPACSKRRQWSRIGYLLSEQDSDRGRISL